MKDKVIYTAITGNYDAILQPKIISEEYDYVLFSNDIKEDNIGVWMIRKIPYENDDKTRVARYVKTHPEELLDGYKQTVWMDANIQINSLEFYDIIDSLIYNNVIISSMFHNERNCAYDEIAAVIYCNVEYEKTATRWLKKLLAEKYPKDNGMFETNVLYRNISDNYIKRFDALWWDCINHYSRRDQLSFNYSLWRLQINCHYLLGKGVNARNTNLLNYVVHSNTSQRMVEEKQSKLLNYYRLYSIDSNTSITNLSHLLEYIYKSKYDAILLWYWGLLYQIKWNIHKKGFTNH